MALGRPKKPKVKITDLLKYLDALPANSTIRKNLTTDKMLVIRRYVEELKYLEETISRLKADIDANGQVEMFKQGRQQLRRANPAVEMYFSSLRAYRALVNKINDILRGVEVIW